MVVSLLGAAMSSCHEERQSRNIYGPASEAEVAAYKNSGESCRPAFRPLTEDAIKVRIDPHLEMGASFILIGCASDLQQVDSGGSAKLQAYFASVIKDKHYFLERDRLKPDFRKKMVSGVNSLLGREYVTDVLVYGIYSTEFGPG